MKTVLQKFIADSGFCSRRRAEDLIRQAKVSVNGRPAELGMRVDEGDKVEIGKIKIGLAKEKIYIKLNKPKNYTCTNRGFEGEKNIFDLVKIKERLFVAGRLDKNSRGLVLLTNDGELAQKLTHPKFEHKKNYQVKIRGSEKIKTENIIKALKKGVDIGEGDGIVKVKDAQYIGGLKFIITLVQGKKRQIRRMFKVIGFEVGDLIRVRIGSLELGDLAEGQWKILEKKEIELLKNLK